MVSDMEKYVDLCFNDVEVNGRTVDKLVDMAETEPLDGAKRINALKKLAEIKGTMDNGKAAIGAGVTIRECFDNAFYEHLGPMSEVRDMFADRSSHRWLAALDDYYDAIIDELPKVVETITEMNGTSAEDEDEDEEAKRTAIALRTCVSKVKVIRALLVVITPGIVPFVPFMSRSVYSHLVVKTELIKGALQEVSTTRSIMEVSEIRQSRPLY